MPVFEVTSPDGRTLELEGATPPDKATLDRIFAQIPGAEAPSFRSKVGGLAKKAALGGLEAAGTALNEVADLGPQAIGQLAQPNDLEDIGLGLIDLASLGIGAAFSPVSVPFAAASGALNQLGPLGESAAKGVELPFELGPMAVEKYAPLSPEAATQYPLLAKLQGLAKQVASFALPIGGLHAAKKAMVKPPVEFPSNLAQFKPESTDIPPERALVPAAPRPNPVDVLANFVRTQGRPPSELEIQEILAGRTPEQAIQNLGTQELPTVPIEKVTAPVPGRKKPAVVQQIVRQPEPQPDSFGGMPQPGAPSEGGAPVTPKSKGMFLRELKVRWPEETLIAQDSRNALRKAQQYIAGELYYAKDPVAIERAYQKMEELWQKLQQNERGEYQPRPRRPGEPEPAPYPPPRQPIAPLPAAVPAAVAPAPAATPSPTPQGEPSLSNIDKGVPPLAPERPAPAKVSTTPPAQPKPVAVSGGEPPLAKGESVVNAYGIEGTVVRTLKDGRVLVKDADGKNRKYAPDQVKKAPLAPPAAPEQSVSAPPVAPPVPPTLAARESQPSQAPKPVPEAAAPEAPAPTAPTAQVFTVEKSSRSGLTGGIRNVGQAIAMIVREGRGKTALPQGFVDFADRIRDKVENGDMGVEAGLDKLAERTAKAAKKPLDEVRQEVYRVYQEQYQSHSEKPQSPLQKLAGEETGAVTMFTREEVGAAVERLKENLRLATTKAGLWPGDAVYARLQNVLHSDEKKILEDNGLKKFLSQPRKPEEVVKFIEENGPRVEVRKLGTERKQELPDTVARMSNLHHQLETLGYRIEADPAGDILVHYKGNEYTAEGMATAITIDIPRAHRDLFQQVADLESQHVDPDIKHKMGTESATVRFQMVNPKPLDKMPGAVDLLVRIPLKNPEIEARGDYGSMEGIRRRQKEAGFKYSSPHYPTEGKNLVAHVRGYVETTPDGKKVFHVFEIQSDWAQAVREAEEFKRKSPSYENSVYQSRDKTVLDSKDPLLPHYERLALKAAIDHARSEGATHIAISDAATAMLTEGHDRAYQLDAVRGDVRNRDILPESQADYRQKGYRIEKVIPQESGMRLHYDTTLPKIAKELTGAEGEMVNFGEHQNASEGGEYMREGQVVKEPRKDLILRNPDGRMKTDITARMYPLDKASKVFSILGSDKAKLPRTGESGAAIHPAEAVKILHERAKEMLAKVYPLVDRSWGPPLTFDKEHILPRLRPHEEAKKIASRPFGIGQIPAAGVFLDPRARARSPHDQSFITYASDKNIGRAVGALLNETYRGKEPIKIDEATGKITNLEANEGVSLYPSDVIESIERGEHLYNPTPEQRQFIQLLIDTVKDAHGMVETETGLKPRTSDFQFPRPVLESKKGNVPATSGMSKLGTKQPFMKERLYRTEQMGAAAERYDPDLLRRVVGRVEQAYNLVAAHRLVNDPALKGKTPTERFPELMEHFKPRLDTGEMTIEDVRKASRHAILNRGEGMVSDPAFHGRVFPREVSDAINKAFGEQTHEWMRKVENVNAAMVGYQAGMDFSAPLIQGLPTLYNRPKAWARGVKNMADALVNEDTFSRYMEHPENKEAAQELAQAGVRLDLGMDYMKGIQEGEMVTRTPIVGPLYERTGRAHRVFLNAALIESWKALRDVTPPEQRQAMIEYLQAMQGRGRTTEVGMHPSAAAAERWVFFAPAMLRGHASFIAALGEKGIVGKQAKIDMARLAMGATLTYLAFAAAMNVSEKRTKEGLDIRNPEFLSLPVTLEDGRTINVGVGGGVRSYARLMGELAETAQAPNAGERFKKGEPFVHWFRGKLAPVPSVIWDVASGEDFLGQPTSIPKAIGERVVPFSLQAVKDVATGETPSVDVAGDIVPQLGGLNTFPAASASPGARRVKRERYDLNEDAQVVVRAALRFGNLKAQRQEMERQLLQFPEGKHRREVRRLAVQLLRSSIRSTARAEGEATRRGE